MPPREHMAPGQEAPDVGFEPEIEDIGNDMVAIGEPIEDSRPSDTPFYDNLVDELEPGYLLFLGDLVKEGYDADLASREEWASLYEKGLQTTMPQAREASDQRTSRGLSKVQHPVIVEAAVQFQAQSIAEMCPPEGPVKMRTIGKNSDAKEARAFRVAGHMNYQTMEEMEEYYDEMDRMLFHLPLTGMTFMKSWHDETLGRNVSQFVEAEDMVTAYGTSNLVTSPRFTHYTQMSQDEFDRRVIEDIYVPIDIEPTAPTSEDSTSTVDDLQGTKATDRVEDYSYSLLEQYLNIDLPGFEDEDGLALPYTVTIDYDTQQVVGVYRNWKEDDEKRRRNVRVVEFRFLPGLGYYGYGLYHAIGGLGDAATGALRALLDAAAYANMQGGFKLKGRSAAGEVSISPGEFVDVDSVVDDIAKSIMPLPFKEPSATLFALLGFCVDAAKSFASTAEMGISDADANTPVGTTVALLEVGARVFTAIHKRLHNSQKRMFKVLAQLNYEYMPDQYPYEIEGEERFVLREDYNPNTPVAIVPVSDPRTFSTTQRIALAQTSLSLAQSAPDLYDQREAHKRMHEALRTPDIESLMPAQEEAVRLDAVAENAALLVGKPITTFPDQDHTAHMIVLDKWFESLPQAAQPFMQQQYMSHRAEHMSMYYTVLAAQAMGRPLQFINGKDPIKETSAQADAVISQQIAQMLQQAPPMMLGPDLPGIGGGQDMQALAEAEAAVVKAKGEAEMGVTEAKGDQQLRLEEQKGQLKMDLQAGEHAQRQAQREEEARINTEIKLAEMATRLEEMQKKAQIDLAIAVGKATQELEAKFAQQAIAAESARKDAVQAVEDTIQ